MVKRLVWIALVAGFVMWSGCVTDDGEEDAFIPAISINNITEYDCIVYFDIVVDSRTEKNPRWSAFAGDVANIPAERFGEEGDFGYGVITWTAQWSGGAPNPCGEGQTCTLEFNRGVVREGETLVITIDDMP